MDAFGNPSSAHWQGQRAKAIVDSARRSVAQLINCSTDEVSLPLLGPCSAQSEGPVCQCSPVDTQPSGARFLRRTAD